jgi:hypothetical protein
MRVWNGKPLSVNDVGLLLLSAEVIGKCGLVAELVVDGSEIELYAARRVKEPT